MTKQDLEYILRNDPDILINFIRDNFYLIFGLDFNDFEEKINKK